MSRSKVIEQIEAEYKKKNVPQFNVGDVVEVSTRILEADGKERLQLFKGLVVAKKGTGLSETFTVYRTAYGSSMDRLFLLHSPMIAKVEVVRSGKVRKSKLTYLQGTGRPINIPQLHNVSSKKENVAVVIDETKNSDATL